MRLPYIPEDVQMEDETDQAIVSRVKHRRGGKLLELDRALLHAPPISDGWNSFLLAIRTQTSLPVSIRECAICRVAILNQAFYEWDHHLPILLSTPDFPPSGADYILRSPAGHAAKQLGLPDVSASAKVVTGASSAQTMTGSKAVDAVVETISQTASGLLPQQVGTTRSQPPSSGETAGLDERHLAVLAYTDAMTVSVSVAEPIFAALRRHFTDREVVEVTSTIAAYNCVSRFLVALDVGERIEKGGASEGGGEQVE